MGTTSGTPSTATSDRTSTTASGSTSTTLVTSWVQATAPQQTLEATEAATLPSATSEATHKGIRGALAGGIAVGIIALIALCAIMVLVRRRSARRAMEHPGELVPTPFDQYSWSERDIGTLPPVPAGISLPKAARHRDQRGRTVGITGPPSWLDEKRGVLPSTPALIATPIQALEAQLAHEIFTLRTSIREMERSHRADTGRRAEGPNIELEGDAPPEYDDDTILTQSDIYLRSPL